MYQSPGKEGTALYTQNFATRWKKWNKPSQSGLWKGGCRGVMPRSVNLLGDFGVQGRFRTLETIENLQFILMKLVESLESLEVKAQGASIWTTFPLAPPGGVVTSWPPFFPVWMPTWLQQRLNKVFFVGNHSFQRNFELKHSNLSHECFVSGKETQD